MKLADAAAAQSQSYYLGIVQTFYLMSVSRVTPSVYVTSLAPGFQNKSNARSHCGVNIGALS